MVTPEGRAAAQLVREFQRAAKRGEHGQVCSFGPQTERVRPESASEKQARDRAWTERCVGMMVDQLRAEGRL